MGEITLIEWADHTFNFIRGCDEAEFFDAHGLLKVHPACLNCYAREGFGKRRGIIWGSVAEGGTRQIAAESAWAQVHVWARKAAEAKVRRRVFCPSLGDALEADVPAWVLEKLWDLIRATSYALDWLLLTKRPERWQIIPVDVRRMIWLGTSISDQETADVWVPRLLAAQGFALRFLSIEPMVGAVSLKRWLLGSAERQRRKDAAYWAFTRQAKALPPSLADPVAYAPPAIGWVIAGGESRKRQADARPSNLADFRALKAECVDAGVPFFLKQMGGRTTMERQEEAAISPVAVECEHGFDVCPKCDAGKVVHLWAHKKGGDPAEWPDDLRGRALPEVRHAA